MMVIVGIIATLSSAAFSCHPRCQMVGCAAPSVCCTDSGRQRPDQLDVMNLARCEGEVHGLAAQTGGCTARRGGATADDRVRARRQRDREMARWPHAMLERQRGDRIELDFDRSRGRMKLVWEGTAL